MFRGLLIFSLTQGHGCLAACEHRTHDDKRTQTKVAAIRRGGVVVSSILTVYPHICGHVTKKKMGVGRSVWFIFYSTSTPLLDYLMSNFCIRHPVMIQLNT